jgi:hypothetical protein
MNSLLVSAFLAAGAPALAPPSEDPQGETFLLSIDDVRIAPGERVTGFKLSSWGVDWIALCRIPTGWRLRAGRSATPDGLFEGQSTHGVTRLENLQALGNVALVRLWAPLQWSDRRLPDGGRAPATFAGTLSFSGRGDVRLGERSLRLVPAQACPKPSN